MANVPHLLLAAGGSRRMGQPKQLLRWGNQTLIEHQIDIRLQTGQPVAIVLGAYSDLILPVIEPLPVTIFINNEWANGMGNSIAFGINMCRNTFIPNAMEFHRIWDKHVPQHVSANGWRSHFTD